jgi:deoxyribose-phosphate aldolase
MDYTYEEIAKMIDHSLLHPRLTDEELEKGCRIAIDYNVATVFIKPYYLRRCAEILADSTVKPATTVGFPHGGHTTKIKVAEAEGALEDGAEELDMVVNVGKVLSEDWEYVRSDIKAVVDLAHERGKIIKVIFENCYLEDRHKIKLCEICGEVGADFIKTSTGYGEGGATIHDLKLMLEYSPPHVQVKAAGGIRTLDKLLEVRTLGVTRIGASRTVDILEECKRRVGTTWRAEMVYNSS